MKFKPTITAAILWIICADAALSQGQPFDSFVSRINQQYNVHIAIAPELIPTLDSALQAGTEIGSIQELVHLFVKDAHLSYQLLDGDKLLLRKEHLMSGNHIVAVIEGVVMDKAAGNPLPFAVIGIQGTASGTQSDDSGHFRLPIRDTSGMVEILYLGYTAQKIPVTSLMDGPVRIDMVVSNIPLEEVTIIIPFQEIQTNEQTQSLDLRGYRFLSEEELTGWNADRLLESVTAYTRFSSDQGIRIRGSEAENSLLLMDGIPVYDAGHFYNIFNPYHGAYFPTVQLYKNNLPVTHGGRIDGMILLESGPRKSRSHLLLDSDLLLTSIEAQLDISRQLVLTAGARFSHTGILKEALSDSTVSNFKSPGKYRDENEWTSIQEPSSDFYDINMGLKHTSPNQTITQFNFYKSHDELTNRSYSDLQATWMNHEIISIEQNYYSQDQWDNLGSAANMKINTSENSEIILEGFYSHFEKQIVYWSELDEQRPLMHKHQLNSGAQFSELDHTGLKSYFRSQVSTKLNYLLGLESQYAEVNLFSREDDRNIVGQSQTELESSLFGEVNVHLPKSFSFWTGGRITHLRTTDQLYVLPAARIRFQPNALFHIETAYSRGLQSLQELTLENRFGREVDFLTLSEPSAGFPVLQSDKYMIGCGVETRDFIMEVEWYYKKITGNARIGALMPDPGSPPSGSPPDDFYRLFIGDGWAAGMDITAYYTRGKVDITAYYSLSKIAERYDELFNGNYFSPQEDRRHQLKLSGKIKWGDIETFGLVTYKSKAPYLSYVRLEGRDGIGMVDQGNVVRYLPSYFSLDLGVDYAFHLFHQPARIGVSLINATNHTNVEELQHLGKINRDGPGAGFFITHQTELLGRTGNIHFRILF